MFDAPCPGPNNMDDEPNVVHVYILVGGNIIILSVVFIWAAISVFRERRLQPVAIVTPSAAT